MNMTDSYYFPGTLFEIEHKCYCWTCMKFEMSSLGENSQSSALLSSPQIGFPLCFLDTSEEGWQMDAFKERRKEKPVIRETPAVIFQT